MNPIQTTHLIWLAGGIQVCIVLANIPLPGKLNVRANLAGVPRFLRQIFYVHWFCIVLIVGLFSALCFGFARELAGANSLGRFLSAVMAAFWALRIVLQWFYYDPDVRRQNRLLDVAYGVALVLLVSIFAAAAARPTL